MKDVFVVRHRLLPLPPAVHDAEIGWLISAEWNCGGLEFVQLVGDAPATQSCLRDDEDVAIDCGELTCLRCRQQIFRLSVFQTECHGPLSWWSKR